MLRKQSENKRLGTKQNENQTKLTKQGGCTKYENNNKISPADEDGSLWLRVCAVGSGPARGTHAAEVAALAEVEAGAAVLAQAGLRALVLVNALGGPQPPLAFGTTRNTNKTENVPGFAK